MVLKSLFVSFMGFYYRQAHFGEPWNWAGPDLLAAWFQRNIRIYSNVVGLIESPDDRVLGIFGAGHFGWLRQNMPTIRRCVYAGSTSSSLSCNLSDTGADPPPETPQSRTAQQGLVVASSLLSGQELRYRHRLIQTSDDADAAAHDAAEAGYSYLKIYDDLSLGQYEAFVEAGENLGLPLDGHIPAAVGLERVLDAGQAIQHMDKIAFTLGGHSGGPAALVEARRLFAGRSAWVTPTLASLRAMDRTGTSEYTARLSRPEMAYGDSASVAWWRSLAGSGTRPAAHSPFYGFQLELLPVLKEAGTRFLLGTDAANPLMVAGFSVHDELEALVVDGGLSPYEALQAATRNAADFLGEPLNGRVQVGARADLLLVESDPLLDLSVLRRPLGVVIGGRWIERSELEASLVRARVSDPG